MADATTLYVNNKAGLNCTDSGAGTQAAPFCHVGAAAAAARPGQTVEIADGVYDEGDLTVAGSGTAEAPITFRGPARYSGGMAHIGESGHPINSFVVKGEHLRFQNLVVFTPDGKPLTVDGARDVSFTAVSLMTGGAHVTNASSQVVFSRSETSVNVEGAAAFTVDGGSTGTVLTTNTISDTRGTAVLVDGAPNTVIVSNSMLPLCGPGVVLTGASGGATVENNVVDTGTLFGGACAGVDPAQHTGITVAAAATAGTKVDYNIVDSRSDGLAYNWAGTAYTDQPAFTAASGQGVHDYVEPDSSASPGTDAPVGHRIDSADENAPGMPATDFDGRAPVDDPRVPNTGTGSGFRDRGSGEKTNVGSAFTPAGPTRLLDTREPIGVPSAQAVPAWSSVELPVAGVAGVPATGLTAVMMNVTVTEPTKGGHLTVYPHGDAVPNASNLNWEAGRTIANLVTVPVKDGKVSFFNASDGPVHLIADLAGYYSSKGDLFHPQGPSRLLDTREPIGVPSAQAVPAWGTVDLPVAGVAGIPATGVTAVTMNVTVTEPTVDGHLTVYPHGGAAPNASNVNWTAGRTIPNLVTVPVKDGKVSFYNASGGTVHLLADLAGYYTAEGRLSYRPYGPTRMMDTRTNFSTDRYHSRPAGAVAAWGTLSVYMGSSGSTAARTLNVTVTEPGAEGHLTVYPGGEVMPKVSNLNFVAGETIANQVVVPVKGDWVSFYNASGAPIHVVVDSFGSEQY
ncbi:right-handed parallel beta-helix repeat-containing protein [Kitasatospora sp. NPDC056181]|uniref:right-handed parallel beta-helix repeat-containing protein n=1 Tax=Kitasatospora sp. NPDC056181 TaxID=3345737 RepID=UPI0035DA246E